MHAGAEGIDDLQRQFVAGSGTHSGNYRKQLRHAPEQRNGPSGGILRAARGAVQDLATSPLFHFRFGALTTKPFLRAVVDTRT